ncbi:MAG TPA: hypothetical protein VFG63_15125 [Nocardioidaceae bacterium]|nr:hypothetical protein [Nocardioidaceae bacterium]
MVTQVHTGGDANDHLVTWFFALDARVGGAASAARLGAVSAVVALAMYGVLQAVECRKPAGRCCVGQRPCRERPRLRWTLAVSRAPAYLMGLSGIIYLVQGWVVGSEGFSGTHTILILAAWTVSLAWMIWLVAAAWRVPSSQAAPRPAG